MGRLKGAARHHHLFPMRLPNILAIEPRPFEAVNFEDEEEGGDEDSKGKADNVIRWRDTEGSGRQSNARIVTWSDGSMTLHVGSEARAHALLAATGVR